uniref:Uncharacterized protein n=1 Tax=Sphaerodactylus townsendi TaxID=933632 RepID=A0ACB8G3D6_9SAUR
MTTFSESPKPISVSQKTSTEYKAPLFLTTTKMSAVSQPVGLTKSDFTKEFTDMAVTVPLVTKRTQPVQTTGYSSALYAITMGLETAQSKEIPSVSTTSLESPLPEAQSTMTVTLQPITIKTTSFPPIFPLITELQSTVTSRSTPELTVKAALGGTGITLSPYPEFSSQLATIKEVPSTKGLSTSFTSITFPLTLRSTTPYLVGSTGSPYTLTQKIPEIPATAKQPIETKVSVTTPEATHSVATSTIERVSSHVKEEFSVPFLMTKTLGKHIFSPASKAYLTTKGTTAAYHFPAEVARTSIHTKSAFTMTESAVKVAASFPFQSTSEPVVAPSAISVLSTKVPLISKAVPQTLKADIGFQTTLLTSGRKATDFTSSKRPSFTTSKVTATLLPLATMMDGAVDLTPAGKPESSSSTTKQALTLTESSTLLESTPSSFFTPETLPVETKNVSSLEAEADRQALVTDLSELHLLTKQSTSFSSLGSTILTTTFRTPSAAEVLTFSTSSIPVTVFPNATAATSFSTYFSTKPIYESTTEHSLELATVEAVSAVTASVFIPSKEPTALPTCIPISENECIKHICLDGQLIQVNRSQNCPYNATQPGCGFLGFAVQINGDKCCPKWECACRCTVFSDLTYITFDGHHLALFKEASYVVAQTSDETISIHVTACRNMPMDILASSKLCLVSLNLTYSSNQIIVDRLNRKIAVNSRYAWPTVRKYGFKIEDTGFMYLIETPTSIRIQWFHNTGVMVIELNATSNSKANGLCGFCDGSSTNDLMLPNRTVVSSVDASVIFVDSWQVPNTLKYVGEPRSREANCSIMDCSFCLNILLNQTFSSCHPYVSPDSFCDLWVQDTEYIQNPCIALAAYVAMCNKFNICIEWRSSNYCRGFHYKACIPACDTPVTCQNMDPVLQDSDFCLILTEGCVCAEGNILHRAHSALCIPEEKCACTDNSGVPRALGETWKTSLSGCCMFKCVENETITPVEYNCSISQDVECQHFGEVALIVPDDQTCCPQKVCTCNQSLCETLIPKCKDLEKLATYYRDDSCCPSYACECDPTKCESMEQIPNCQPDQTLIAAHVEGSCCVSYICACGICSDQIPKCLEGEVLTVDGNTTDRCCPSYQCVCETYRCPEFKCVLGMSLVEVWSPEKCCPYRTCECACDTIPTTQCKLGEKLIIDEQFQNSTENICHCTKYKCLRDKVCLNNERGVLLPGQSIVEHTPDGVCYTSYCTNVIDPVTKYFRINISSVDCVARCRLNQVYEPPRDLTTCCGQCKNVSCVHSFSNGTVSHFKPGTSWVSNCVRYDCTDTPVGPVLITSSVSCPPFNETECVKVGGYIVPFLNGCCKTCKEDGKFCKKVTVRMTIRKNDCRSNTPVNIVSCDGKCPSASIYNYNINAYARFCKCCRELGLHRRNVQLYCSSNSTWVSYTIQEPTDCSCQWS